jgi:hypothetical protein
MMPNPNDESEMIEDLSFKYMSDKILKGVHTKKPKLE